VDIVEEFPVVISGGGSVGLSLAAELGWRDVKCLVIEQSDHLNPHPRANAVANRTMEYYRRWGIDTAITDAGVPPDQAANYYWLSSFHGKELHRISLPPFTKINEVNDTSGYVQDEHTWSPYLKTITGQNEVEKAIFNYIQTLDSVEYRFNSKLVKFKQDDKGVNITIQESVTKNILTIRSQYLIACDGGRSKVREKLGIGLIGSSDIANFVSIYFRAPKFMSCHKFGPANIFFPLHIKYAGFILNWDGGQTFTYHLKLKRDEVWDDIDPIAAIEAVLGTSTPIEIISTQPWTAHALVAEKYRDNRILLAGDAAHLFTPTGGFGMNTGVSDIIDLAWKVQAMLEGWGGINLLDSYFEERHPIGVRNVMEAADCFELLDNVMQYGDVLDNEGQEGDALRLRLGIELKAQEKLIASSGTLLGYRYEGSSIIIPDNTPEPKDNPRTYIPTSRPGHRAPHIWLHEGVSLLDKFGVGFTLLNFGDESNNCSLMEEAAKSIGLPLEIVKINNPDAANLYEKKFVLIRPDLMVAWRDDSLPTDPTHVLNIIRGHISGT
jgi:2-polyprenyl-6-methoxyphenol hydroxylase-like FAD-dependent oxidoreductase